MRRAATRRYKAKMDCLEKEYTFTSHKTKIPRWYGFTATGHLELHLFSESSMSNPKLELQAGVIAVRLKTTVMEKINLEIKKYYFGVIPKQC